MWRAGSTTFGKWSTPGPVFAYIAEKIVAFVGQVGDGLCRLPGSHRAIAKLDLLSCRVGSDEGETASSPASSEPGS